MVSVVRSNVDVFLTNRLKTKLVKTAVENNNCVRDLNDINCFENRLRKEC